MGDDLEQSADGDGAAARRLGERLKKLREYLGMSQQYVAECTGIPRSAVSDIERGQRRVDAVELTKFARLYQVPVSWLLDEDEQATADTHALALFTRKFRPPDQRGPGAAGGLRGLSRCPPRRPRAGSAARGAALTLHWATRTRWR